MSWAVTIKTISDIKPIPDASVIEVAIVGDGWPCVVRKGEFKVGDRVIYYPEDSMMPDNILQRMGLVGKLSGPNKNRVKAIALRQQLSIGLIERVDVLGVAVDNDVDISEMLGVTKYEPIIPENLRGIVRSHPMYWLKYDIDNINNCNVFNPYDYVWYHEKLHGTNSSFSYSRIEGFNVSSKNRTLQRDDDNVYWKIAIKNSIEEKLKDYYEKCKINDDATVYLHGEIIGDGIQDLTYSINNPELFVFDLRINSRNWVPPPILSKICNDYQLNMVPLLDSGLYEGGEVAKKLAGGKSLLDHQTIREGVVVRNYDRSKIAKIISPEYTLRKGGTEYN